MRPGKLFTANSRVMVGEIARLKGDLPREIVDAVANLLRAAIPSAGDGDSTLRSD